MPLLSLINSHIDLGNAEGLFKVVGVDFYHETPLAAVDKDMVEVEDTGLRTDLQFCACSKGTGTTDQITRMLLGYIDIARMDLLNAQLSGKILRGNFAITMHQDDESFFGFVLHDQGLNNPMLGDVQTLSGLVCPPMLYIRIEMGSKVYLLVTKYTNRLGNGIVRLAHCSGILSSASLRGQ